MGFSINDTFAGSAAALSLRFGVRDETLKTASTAEKSIRNKVAFSNVYFSFPSSQNIASKVTTMQELLGFPAYITNFQDTYTPNWGEETVFGRADPIPVYKNTSRTVTIGFLIPCYDKKDSNENLKKINILIKNLYPGYEQLSTGARVLASSPLIRVKFANLLINHSNPQLGLLGYVKSFSTDFGIKERGVFISPPGGIGSYTNLGTILPRAIGFQMTFTPLHESTVGFRTNSGANIFFGNESFPYATQTRFGDVAAQVSKAVGMATSGDFKSIATEVLGWDGD